ncbi:lipopolysaccharide heptosyltransferase I [Rhodopseudomonas sp. BR0M22]|uniref:lipopolysaccharide heptosyltransferase I n=1 Tax=Rhodopseudomonas sp. BR0M22 TaxID=2269369 RepID=UPI0013DED502|nr:lipopolysaccharide heptosyltransferase I [Rhodopseudomonas sp. BR0M22]NEW90501.1 lipopolysaccharide heptosyltransferase I [Rhodopseudomonas sp. BR0M22]
MSDILIIKTSSLGDVVHQMPAIADAARAMPGLRISWVVEEAFAPLAQLHPSVAEVIPVATRRWRSHLTSRATWREIGDFNTRLREPEFDKVIDTQGLIRSAIIARLAQGERHGYDAQSIREPLASRFYNIRHSVSRALHAVARNRELTALSLGYRPPDEIDYGLIKPGRSGDAPYALLLHGTSRTSKEWRAEDWIETGRWLHARGLQAVLPWGTETERQTAELLSNEIPGSRVLPRQRLDLTAGVIARATVIIGVDTGLLHLAAAYRVPLVGIYVATDPGLTGPVGSGAMRVLGSKSGGPSVRQAIEAAEQLLG